MTLMKVLSRDGMGWNVTRLEWIYETFWHNDPSNPLFIFSTNVVKSIPSDGWRYDTATRIRSWNYQWHESTHPLLTPSCTLYFITLIWQKKLDFKNIDSFHGTGAFNVTLFPEWDSLFLDLANQDAEQVIIEVKQKRTHRGWAHQASYINNINGGTGASSKMGGTSVHRSRGIAGNYLAALNRDASSPSLSSPSGTQPAKKPIPRAAGISGSYLDALNQKVPAEAELSPKKKKGRKTRKEREQIKMERKKKLDAVESPKPSKSTLGIQAGYLETLFSNTIDSTAIETEERPSRKVNPFLEQVRVGRVSWWNAFEYSKI